MNASAERSTLPALSDDEQAHCAAVSALIRQAITDAGGWIGFDSFMELALYAPGLGYYSAGTAKLGVGGDFVTAPELSDLFSTCLARQCAEILRETGGSILELGAGSGRMASIVLQTLESLNALPQHYAILEVSADLKSRQEERIGRLAGPLRDRVQWLDRLPSMLMSGVVLANEVLDALPCERFLVRDGEVSELGVGVDASGDSLIEQEAPARAALAAQVRSIGASLPSGFPSTYRSELCTRITPWLAALAQCLDRGAMLLFDYGLPRSQYYHPQRDRGTLRCHFRQRAHDDPLLNVGVQDITAWVDFTRVAEAADQAGLSVSGFTSQAAFLLGTGIEQVMARATDAIARARLAGEARQLLMPGEMGEIFKAIALTRGCDIPLAGFAMQDLRHSL